MKVAGFDIGGANTDLAIVEYENGEIKVIQTVFEYLPMWSQNERLGNVLYDLIEKICPVDEIDAVGISMTAELVDAFETKAQGVLDIATTCEKLFDCPVAYIGTDKVLSLAELIANPIEVAAANWIATSHIVAEIEKDCIFVDTGSTTTDIIPIKDGKECAKGRTDFERSATGELVYTGTLRTNLTSFVDSIPTIVIQDETVVEPVNMNTSRSLGDTPLLYIQTDRDYIGVGAIQDGIYITKKAVSVLMQGNIISQIELKFNKKL